jgi:hypothetical protein
VTYEQLQRSMNYAMPGAGTHTSTSTLGPKIRIYSTAGQSTTRVNNAANLKNANPSLRCQLYIDGFQMHDPNSDADDPPGTPATNDAFGNMIFWNDGDAANERDNYPEIFLTTSGAKTVSRPDDGRYLGINPAAQRYRDILVSRLNGYLLTASGGSPSNTPFDEFFWDDGYDGAMLNQSTDQYGTINASNTAWEMAVLGLLTFLRDQYLRPNNVPILSNIVVSSDAVWRRHLSVVDGVMIENFALDWDSDYYSRTNWLIYQNRALECQSKGKTCWCVLNLPSILSAYQYEQGTGGTQANYNAYLFGICSYLLIKSPLSYIRADTHSTYNNWYEFNLDTAVNQLGVPIGPATVSSNIWTRQFENGTVTVNYTNSSAPTASISYTQPTRPAGLYRPEIAQIHDHPALTMQGWKYQVRAWSHNGGTLRYSASGLPKNCRIDPDTGLIYGRLKANAHTNSPYTITVTVTEGNLTVSDTFTLTVSRGTTHG